MTGAPNPGPVPAGHLPWVRWAEEQLRDTKRTAKFIESSVNAAVSAQNSTQGQIARTVETVENAQRQPATPVILSAESEGYWNTEGVPTGRVELSWVHVADESVVVTTYEVWADDHVWVTFAVPEFQFVQELTPAEGNLITFTADGFEVGSNKTIRVRARSEQGVWSELSAPEEVEFPLPVGSLAAPTNPVVTSELGAITVAWDGLLTDGAPSKRFDRVIVEMSDTAAGTYAPVGQALLGAGTVAVTGVPAGNTVYLRLRALDKLGAPSAPSAYGSATSQGVDVSAIEQELADLSEGLENVATGPIDGVRIVDDSISAPKLNATEIWTDSAWVNKAVVNVLTAGSVKTLQLDAQAVTAEKMKLGALDAFLITGGNIQTDAAASRGVNINSAGITAYNAAGAQTFRIVSGTGAVSATGDFQSGSGNSIFKATSLGIQLGHATFASAPFSVTAAGALKATNATISGTINATGGTISGNMSVTGSLLGGTYRTAPASQGNPEDYAELSSGQLRFNSSRNPGVVFDISNNFDQTTVDHPGDYIRINGDGAFLEVGATNVPGHGVVGVNVGRGTGSNFYAYTLRSQDVVALGEITGADLTINGTGANTIAGATTFNSTLTVTGQTNLGTVRSNAYRNSVGNPSAPYAMAVGSKTMTIKTWEYIAFPPGRFTVPPILRYSIVSTNGPLGYGLLQNGSLTKDGFTIAIFQYDGLAILDGVVHWEATQMTPTSAAG